jgi:hypothetical protein
LDLVAGEARRDEEIEIEIVIEIEVAIVGMFVWFRAGCERSPE